MNVKLDGALDMKISLNWLKDYIDINDSAQEVAEILSNLGFPCEGIEHLDDDAIIDLEITSNRGDCLGYIGVAREIAAVTGKELKLPSITLDQSQADVTELVTVEISEPDLCSRYTARIIQGIKVAPSPEWLKKRLEAVGLRSVNNVVDATNYAMLETGQPPHAFDYDKIAQGKIIVRKAAAGEIIISIDGSKCELTPDMLIIADANKPIAIAGVMGGLDSEVSETTTTILLEDAYFDPVSVRTTSRKLALPSDASFRFERTVDVEAINWASKRTAQLIIQVAGGKAAPGVVDVYPKKPSQKQVTLRLSRLNKLLGIEISCEEVVKILAALNFTPQQKNDSILCTSPSWRSDVYREADLVEEVCRVHGHDKIPTEQKISIEVTPVDTRQKAVELIGNYLNSCGFYETINVTFIDNSIADLFANKDTKHLAVKDVSKKNANLLRQTLMGSLLVVLQTNLNAKNTPCRVFEIADTFASSAGGKPGLPDEKTKLALVCDGDFRQLRGVVDGLVKTMDRVAEVTFSPVDLVWAEAGAEVLVNGKVIGVAGIASSAVKEKFDFKDVTPCCVELEFEKLANLKSETAKIKPIPKFPAVERDLSLIVDDSVLWNDIFEAVNKTACNELEDVRFVGIYRGKEISEGKKSVTLSLRFRDEDGTLTHEIVDDFEAKIFAGLRKAVDAKMRTI